MKKLSAYETKTKPYYAKMRKQGWRSYLVFGPETMINELKEWLRDYKVSHDMYIRKQWASKPRKLL